MKDVRGTTVVITGGAAGMGLLWAERFAKDGANLVLWDVDGTGLDKAKGQLSALGVDIITQVVDVSKRENVYKAAKKVLAETSTVDVLVNNAGIVFAGPLLETPDEKIAKILDVDLKALFWTTKAFLPGMIERNTGHIINISSAAGLVGVPKMPAYVAAKWGVIGMTESLRLELRDAGKKGIHFTLVCPSYVDTGMFEGAQPPRLTKMLRPEDLVNAGYEAFKKNRYIVRKPWMVKVTPALKALLPWQFFDAVSDMLGVTRSMDAWKESSDRDR